MFILFIDVFGALMVPFFLSHLLDRDWPAVILSLIILVPMVTFRRAWRILAYIPALLGPIPRNLKSYFTMVAAVVALAGVGLLGFLVMFAVLEQLADHSLLNDFIGGKAPAPWMHQPMVSVVVSPVVEELVFRGYLFKTLCKRYSHRLSVLICSSMFAVLHVSLLGAFLAALILASVYIRTGSLLTAMIVHACWNGANVLLPSFELTPPYIYGALICGSVSFLWLTSVLWPKARPGVRHGAFALPSMGDPAKERLPNPLKMMSCE